MLMFMTRNLFSIKSLKMQGFSQLDSLTSPRKAEPVASWMVVSTPSDSPAQGYVSPCSHEGREGGQCAPCWHTHTHHLSHRLASLPAASPGDADPALPCAATALPRGSARPCGDSGRQLVPSLRPAHRCCLCVCRLCVCWFCRCRLCVIVGCLCFEARGK